MILIRWIRLLEEIVKGLGVSLFWRFGRVAWVDWLIDLFDTRVFVVGVEVCGLVPISSVGQSCLFIHLC